jgi:hypothetical protein
MFSLSCLAREDGAAGATQLRIIQPMNHRVGGSKAANPIGRPAEQ